MVSIENSHLIVEKLGSRGSCSLSLIWNVGNKVLLEGGVLLKAPTLAFGSMFLEYYGNQNFPMLRSRTLPNSVYVRSEARCDVNDDMNSL